MKLGKYKHYKSKLYEVVGIARHSETLKEMVIYRAKNALWARPKDMFFGKVIVGGKEIPRFEFLE